MSKRKFKIAVMPCDGIGPEVMDACISVLDYLATQENFSFEYIFCEAGDTAKKKYGEALPKETFELCQKSDAILKGPAWESAAEVLMPIRQGFELFANVRPVKSYGWAEEIFPGIDLIIVRENTEDLYKGIEWGDETRMNSLRVITKKASKRIANFAFELAKRRKKLVTCVHKGNVLKSCKFFRDIVFASSANYPDVKTEELLVDACAFNLIKNPRHFDVIVTTNIFGDILSDEAGGLVGSLGLLPSANVGEEKAMFEPVHGSAPDIAGKGIANPLAMILASAMMLDWLGEHESSVRIRVAIEQVVKKGATLTPDLNGIANTVEVTNEVIKHLSKDSRPFVLTSTWLPPVL